MLLGNASGSCGLQRSPSPFIVILVLPLNVDGHLAQKLKLLIVARSGNANPWCMMIEVFVAVVCNFDMQSGHVSMLKMGNLMNLHGNVDSVASGPPEDSHRLRSILRSVNKDGTSIPIHVGGAFPIVPRDPMSLSRHLAHCRGLPVETNG